MAGPFDLLANKRRSAEEQAGLDSLLNRAPAPAPKYEETAPAPQGMSDDELALRSAPTPALQFGGGIEQLKAMSKNAIAAAAQAASNDGVDRPGVAAFGQRMRASAQQNEAEASRLFEASGAPMSMKDVDGFGSAMSYLGAGVTRNAPQIGAMIAGRGVLGKAGVPVSAVGMNVGDIYGEGQSEIDAMVKAGQLDPQREQKMRDQVLINSGVGGLIAGALDTIGFSAMFPGAKGVAAQAVARSLPRAVLNAAGKEGGTEIVQEYVALVANKLALEKPQAMGLTEDDMWRLADAGALGAAGGATFGLPGNLVGQAGAVADKAIDAGAGLYQRAKGAAGSVADLPGNVSDAVNPAGVGQKSADWVNAIMSGDVPSIKAGVSAAGDALMQVPGVSTVLQEGGDFIKGLRVPPRAQAAWDKYEPQVKQGWEQFKAAFADKIDTGNIESAYDYYKKTLAVTMPTIGKVDPAAAGAAMGETITAFNEWVGRNEPVFRSIVGAAVNTAKDVAPIVAEKATDAASAVAQGVAENAPIAASVAKTAAGGMYEILDKYGIQPGKDFAKGVDARIKEELRDTDPPSDEEVEASANALLEQLRSARGTTKQSSIPMRSNGAKIIRSTLLDMVPRMDKNTADQYARSLDEMLNDRTRTEQHLNSPEGREMIGQLFNLTPSEFLARLYVDLREFGQDSDTQKAAFTPGDETYATDSTVGVQQETDLADKTAGTIAQESGADIDYVPDDDVDFSFGGMDADTSVDAPRGDEVELDPKHYEEAMAQLYNEAGKQIGFTRAGPPELTFLKKALYKPGDKIKMKDGKVINRDSAKGGKQWVIGTKTVEGEAPQTFDRQINLADLGIFASQDVKAGADKKNRNFKEGFGKLFGETFVDNTADGKRVEYTFQPATMRDEGPVPIDPAAWDKWLRPDSKITKEGQTWGEAGAEALDKARRQPISGPSALAASKRLIDDMVANELSDFRIENARNSAYKSAGIQAVSELYNLFPADPKDKADESVREIFQATRNAIEGGNAAPAPVESIWAFLNRDDAPPAEWDDYVARFEAAGRANDFAAVRTGRPLVNPAMRESWAQLAQTPVGDVLVAVQLLPKEVLDVARDAMLKKLDEIEEKRLGPPAPELDEAMSRPETLEAEGPVTEDMGGQFIEYKPTAQDAERGTAFAAARDNLRAKIKKYGRKTPQAKALKAAMNAINDPRTSIEELRAMAADDLTGSTAAAIVRASRARMDTTQGEGQPVPLTRAEATKSVVAGTRRAAADMPRATRTDNWLANPEEVRGVKISYDVRVADTNEVATVTEDAADALISLKQRESVLEKLMGCLK